MPKVNLRDVASINEWPESQICMGCDHSEFLFSGTSRYLCYKQLGADGIRCIERTVSGIPDPDNMIESEDEPT